MHSLRRPAGPGHLDLERVVEAIEIVEQADDANEFDELPFVVMCGDGVPYVVMDVSVAQRDSIGQPERGGFRRLEMRIPRFGCFERVNVLLRRPVAPCQGAVTGGSVPAIVEDRDAHGEQFFELSVGGSLGVPERAHVIGGGLHRRRAVCVRPKHVGHVIARLEEILQYALRL